MSDKPSILAVFEFYGLAVVGSERSIQCKAQCPLPGHEDANPSATINTEENLFFCYACNIGGDSYDVVKEREQLAGWADTRRRTEEIAGRGDGSVRSERGGSGLLPRRSGNRGERSVFRPPWTRL